MLITFVSADKVSDLTELYLNITHNFVIIQITDFSAFYSLLLFYYPTHVSVYIILSSLPLSNNRQIVSNRSTTFFQKFYMRIYRLPEYFPLFLFIQVFCDVVLSQLNH